jgi:hypothetical protein
LPYHVHAAARKTVGMANAFTSTDYPETEPLTLVAGDFIAWKRTDLGTDYPPASYALTYSARLDSAGTEIAITASESGDDYLIEVASATSAAWTVGFYTWQAYITRTSDSARITISTGRFEILANRDAATTDPRTHARKMLTLIEALLEGRAVSDVDQYEIAGRSLRKMNIRELQEWRNRYRAELAAEDRRIRLAAGHTAQSLGVRL